MRTARPRQGGQFAGDLAGLDSPDALEDLEGLPQEARA
jgi:hypothetical protein